MPRSSQTSDRVYVLKPEPCRLRVAWWACVHGLAGVGLAASGLPLALRVLALAALVGHALWRRPAPAPLVLVTEAGRWSVPELRLYERRAGPGSAFTSLWVRLVLGSAPRAVTVVLLKPEYRAGDWRRIQLALRAPTAPERPAGRA